MRQVSRAARVSLVVSILIAPLCGAPALAAPTIAREVFHEPSRGRIGEPLLIFGAGLVSPVRVFFASAGGTVEATPVAFDANRGVVTVRVPAGAVTGNMKIRANGVDSANYYFRVESGAFTQGTDVVSGKVKTGSGAGVASTLVAL